MALIISRRKHTECPVGCVDCTGLKAGQTPCSLCGYEENIAFDHYKEKGHYVLARRIQMKKKGGMSNDVSGFEDAEDWQKAEKGDADSMFRLGYLFSLGTGVPQDHQLAVWWYEKAVNKGCTDALTALGQAYSEGLGVSKDEQYAEQLLLTAFKGFSPTAGSLLGMMALENDESSEVVHQASRYFRQSAKLDDPLGQVLYAKLLLLGGGIDQDIENGMYWLRKAMANGDETAWGFMGDLFLGKIDGVDIGEINQEKARECYYKAASKGSLDYQLALAKMLLNAEGGEQKIPEALEWLEKLAEENYLPAIAELSRLYLTEVYVPRDWEKAKYWIEQGASQNDEVCLKILRLYNQAKQNEIESVVSTGDSSSAGRRTSTVRSETGAQSNISITPKLNGVLNISPKRVLIMAALLAGYWVYLGADVKKQINECAKQPEIKHLSPTLVKAKALNQCLKTNSSAMELFYTRSEREVIDNLPNTPCRFVGTWESIKGQWISEVTLFANGHYVVEPLNYSQGTSGSWGEYNNQFVWLDNNNPIWPPDINTIDSESENKFTLIEMNGKKTVYRKILPISCDIESL